MGSVRASLPHTTHARALASSFVAALAFVACKPVVHPNDPTIPRIMCEARCQRDRDCDARVSVADCEARCEHLLSPRAIHYRADYVAAVHACALRQSCVADTDRAIQACVHDVFVRLQPTAAAETYCQGRMRKDADCRVLPMYREDRNHCLAGVKAFSDPILAQLAECNEGICRARAMCVTDVIGYDELADDDDYQRRRKAVRVETGGPATLTLEATVQSESPPAALTGVDVCLQGTKECATTDDAGEASLPIPAHSQLAVTFVAPTYHSVLVPLTTAGNSLRLAMRMQTEESVRARFARVGVAIPDPANGMVTVKAWSMEGKGETMEGVRFVLAGKEPIYFAPDGAPAMDRHETSTWGVAAFPGLPAGTVEITAGPAGVVCVPGSWAWPSPHESSLTAPVVPGFTTEVSMQCHR
jgi:hypothetical protein